MQKSMPILENFHIGGLVNPIKESGLKKFFSNSTKKSMDTLI